LGQHDFRLPGLGSYMSLAIERGDGRGQVLGVLAMLGMIVFFDQVVWRPVVAWSQKFTDEERGSVSESWLWERIRRSRLGRFSLHSVGLIWRRSRRRRARPARGLRRRVFRALKTRRLGKRVVIAALACGGLFGFVKYVHLLTSLVAGDWFHLLSSTAATLLRVLAAVLLASLWTVPAGVMIGRSPRLGAALSAHHSDGGEFPGANDFPGGRGRPVGPGGGLGHQFRTASDVGHAMVHPVQRHRGQ